MMLRQPSAVVASWFLVALGVVTATAQPPIPGIVRQGDPVPRDVRDIYEKGLKYLGSKQLDDGRWGGSHQGPGTTGMALMCFLAAGEDPNFGTHSTIIRKAVKAIVKSQDNSTGYFGSSMYHHGFAMLGLAEAYGTVDDRNFWPENAETSIGQSLELAVRSAITSQKKNPFGAWRYSPSANDADTSVAGAVTVGLLAARNAGIEVPDESIDRAVSYFKSMTSDSGQVGYSGGFGGFDESFARISIAALVYSIAKRQDLSQHKATVTYLADRVDSPANNYVPYTRYYRAQALFQGDMEAWEDWNELLVRQLKQTQLPDGSFPGDLGSETSTALTVLSLALNYRFLPIYER